MRARARSTRCILSQDPGIDRRRFAGLCDRLQLELGRGGLPGWLCRSQCCLYQHCGGTSGISSNSNVHLDCPAPMENQYSSFDPLAKVKPPSYSSCQPVPGGKTKTLSPGTFCNKSLSGDITLVSGTYILKGGRISLGGNGSLKGYGVTIFLMEDAEFSVNGNEVVQLTPPSSRRLRRHHDLPREERHKHDHHQRHLGLIVSGFVYAPGGHVFYAGNSATSTQSECLRIVGNTVEMTVHSDISRDCAAQLRQVPSGQIYVDRPVRGSQSSPSAADKPRDSLAMACSSRSGDPLQWVALIWLVEAAELIAE